MGRIKKIKERLREKKGKKTEVPGPGFKNKSVKTDSSSKNDEIKQKAQFLFEHYFAELEDDSFGDKTLLDATGITTDMIKDLMVKIMEYRFEGMGSEKDLIETASSITSKFEGSEKLNSDFGYLINDLARYSKKKLTSKIRILENMKREEELPHSVTLLVEELKSGDKDRQDYAIGVLSSIKGDILCGDSDLSSAIPHVIRIRRDMDADNWSGWVNKYARRVMTTINSKKELSVAMPLLIDILNDETQHIKGWVSNILSELSKKGIDVSAADSALAPYLIDLLKEPFTPDQRKALVELSGISKRGNADISGAVPHLLDNISIWWNWESVINSVEILLNIADRGTDASYSSAFRYFGRLVAHQDLDEELRIRLIDYLKKEAKKGTDISDALRYAKRVFDYDNENIAEAVKKLIQTAESQ